jgi:hypothetical protein
MSQQITGNLSSLNANVLVQVDVATLPSPACVSVQISGNFTGTLGFQATIDQVNWFAVNATPITASGGAAASSTTAVGQFAISVFGFAQVRVIFTSYSAGTAVVSLDTGSAAVPITPLVSVQTEQSSQGGPPLATGLPSLSSPDLERNFQGKDNIQMIVTAVAGQSFITFLDNPWIQGLTTNTQILLSAGPNSETLESVIVGANNIPSTGTGTFVVNLVNAVVNTGSNYATFDVFGPTGANIVGINPNTNGIEVPGSTVIGVKGALQLVIDPYATDPKRPLKPIVQARNAPGVQAMIEVDDPTGQSYMARSTRALESIVFELRKMNFMVAQLKDGSPMDVPASLLNPEASVDIQ